MVKRLGKWTCERLDTGLTSCQTLNTSRIKLFARKKIKPR